MAIIETETQWLYISKEKVKNSFNRAYTRLPHHLVSYLCFYHEPLLHICYLIWALLRGMDVCTAKVEYRWMGRDELKLQHSQPTLMFFPINCKYKGNQRLGPDYKGSLFFRVENHQVLSKYFRTFDKTFWFPGYKNTTG